MAKLVYAIKPCKYTNTVQCTQNFYTKIITDYSEFKNSLDEKIIMFMYSVLTALVNCNAYCLPSS